MCEMEDETSSLWVRLVLVALLCGEVEWEWRGFIYIIWVGEGWRMGEGGGGELGWV